MSKYLCVVIQSSNGKEITSFEIEKPDELMMAEARAKTDAEVTFRNLQKYSKSMREIGMNWHVETCEI